VYVICFICAFGYSLSFACVFVYHSFLLVSFGDGLFSRAVSSGVRLVTRTHQHVRGRPTTPPSTHQHVRGRPTTPPSTHQQVRGRPTTPPSTRSYRSLTMSPQCCCNGATINTFHYTGPSCDKSSEIFPATGGGAAGMCKDMGVRFLGKLPLDPRIAQACDQGKSFLDEIPDSPATGATLSPCLHHRFFFSSSSFSLVSLVSLSLSFSRASLVGFLFFAADDVENRACRLLEALACHTIPVPSHRYIHRSWVGTSFFAFVLRLGYIPMMMSLSDDDVTPSKGHTLSASP
jgi:hypothetical protein